MQKREMNIKTILPKVCDIGALTAGVVVVVSFFMYFITGYFYSKDMTGIDYLSDNYNYAKILLSISLTTSITIVAAATSRLALKRFNPIGFSLIFTALGAVLLVISMLFIEFLRIIDLQSKYSLDMTTKHAGIGLWLNLMFSIVAATFIIIDGFRRLRLWETNPATIGS